MNRKTKANDGLGAAPCSAFPESPEIDERVCVLIPLEWTGEQVESFVREAETKGWVWMTFSQQRMRFIYLPNSQDRA